MTSTPADADPAARAPATRLRRHSASEVLRVVLVATLLGGAVLHAAVVHEHLDHWPTAGLFFVLLAVAGLVVGTALLRRVGAVRLRVALALSVGPLLVWAVSRTSGLPFGPEAGHPEPIALTDAAACLLALTGAGAALTLLRAAPRLRGRALPAAGQLVSLGLIAAVTAVGLTRAAAPQHGHAEDQPPGHVHSMESTGVETERHI